VGSLFSGNLQYLWNGARWDQSYYWWPIGNLIRAFDWCQINDLGWPWRDITYCVSKHVRLSEPTTKIWMKIDPYCQRRRCSPKTLDSGNISFRVRNRSNKAGLDVCSSVRTSIRTYVRSRKVCPIRMKFGVTVVRVTSRFNGRYQTLNLHISLGA